MARRASGTGDASWETFSVRADFLWQPPRRSWPGPPTPLEQLAVRAGVDDEELRALLHDAIQRRRRERGESWDALDRTLRMRENGH